MISITRGEIDHYRGRFSCPEHGHPLEVYYHARPSSYVLRCPDGHYPPDIQAIPTDVELYQIGALPQPPHQPAGSSTQARHPFGRLINPAAVREAYLPYLDLGTKDLLGETVVESLKLYAFGYGLDPYRGHVAMLYARPCITREGYLYLLRSAGLAYALASHPITERERHYRQVSTDAFAWLATLRHPPTHLPVHGVGIVAREELGLLRKRPPANRAAPVASPHPQQLARLRAEWWALCNGVPLGECDPQRAAATHLAQAAQTKD